MDDFLIWFQPYSYLVEDARAFVAWLAASMGLVAWMVFVPQIRLLLTEKKSDNISLRLVWGSFGLQAVLLLHAVFQLDWYMAFPLLTSLVCLVVVLKLIYRYRKYPGGKPRYKQA